MPIYGRALNPRVYGPSPDIQPDNYEYLTHIAFTSRYSTPHLMDFYTIQEDDWYRIWAIGAGGGGGRGASGGSDYGGAGGGGGGHGGIGYYDKFLTAGTVLRVTLSRGTGENTVSVFEIGLTPARITAGYGNQGSSGSGETSVGQAGKTGSISIAEPIQKAFSPFPAEEGSRGSSYGGGSGGWGGYMQPATKYSFGKHTVNLTPPNLNVGNGNIGGDGGNLNASGSKGTDTIAGAVILERGIYTR